MEEKAKSKVLIYIVVVLFLAVLMIAILGIMGYQKMTERMDELARGTTNQGTVAKQEQTAKQEEQTVTQPAYATDPDAKKVTLAGETHYVKVVEKVISEHGENDANATINMSLDIILDGKKVNEIQDVFVWKDKKRNKDIYKILTLKDINGTDEYILLKVIKDIFVDTENLYIIDKNANVVGQVPNYRNAGSSYWEVNKEDAEDYSKMLEGAIYSDYITYYKESNGLQKHKYYIKNGNAVDEIERTYVYNEEYKAAGKKV